MLKETEDKIYFTNSYGQTVTIKKGTLKEFVFKDRLVEHVFPEVAETVDRLFRRQAGHSSGVVSPVAISIELGVNMKTVIEAMDRLEKMGVLGHLPSKSLQVGSTSIKEPGGNDCVYRILKEHTPIKRI